MPRIPTFTEASEFTPAQRRVVDAILGRRGGRLPGPYRVSLHCPELTAAWHPLGEQLQSRSSFAPRLMEFVILLAARAMDCDYVFAAHGPRAVRHGLPQAAVDALARGERPALAQEDEAIVYDYCSELAERRAVTDATYARALAAFGAPGVVELTALYGYYTMVSMTAVAHELAPPAGAATLTRRR